MSQWSSQLVLLPVLLPLLAGALLILISERRAGLRMALSFGSTLAQLAAALTLLQLSDAGEAAGLLVHLAGNWAPPFGIALAADRLSAMLLVLCALLALAALLYAYPLWSRSGVHFHPLFQFLLMGINGAFLTGDIFNLFVFFEIMLAASYGLLLYSPGEARIRAGMQYIAINLLCSFFFLLGAALIYAGAGTLNLADLAQRAPGLAPADRQLLEIGAAVLAIAFLAKSAAWPFCFWLPAAYGSAAPPVGAMLVLMTKVGVYALLRIWLLVFPVDSGASAGFGGPVLFGLGIATLAFGSLGLLASQDLGRMAAHSAIVSSGTLLAALGYGGTALVGDALFYLLSSTLGVAALLLLVELVERLRNPAAAMLAVTMEAFAVEDAPGDAVGVIIPAALAFLGLSYIVGALIVTGMPPLSGFVAKFGLLHGLLGAVDGAGPSLGGWLLLILVVTSGLLGIIALMRFGVRTFWAMAGLSAPRLRVSEAAAVSALLLLCVLLTVQAGPVRGYLERSAAELRQPARYAEGVLSAPVLPSPNEEAQP